LDSAEPTIVYLVALPPSSLTWTTEPTRRRAELVLELRDPRLEHRLLVLGVVVLGVLRDVAELARLLDASGYLAAALSREVLELGLEIGQAFGGENDVLGHDART